MPGGNNQPAGPAAPPADEADTDKTVYTANETADIAKRLASIRGQKSWLARMRTSTRRLLAAVNAGNGDDHTVETIRTDMDKYSRKLDEVQTKYCEMIDAYPNKAEDVSNRANNLVADFMKLRDDVGVSLKAYADDKKAAAPAPGPAAPAAVKVKIDSSLRPKPLSKDFRPAEYRIWERKFSAFYVSSHLELAGIAQQREHLNMCLDAEMDTRLTMQVAKDTAIFGGNGCIDTLKKEFDKLYPLFARRQALFHTTQKKGYSMSLWMAETTRLGEEADLTNLTTEQFYVNKFIIGCSDTKLKMKLMELAAPTLDEVKAMVINYERATAGQAQITDATTSVTQERALKADGKSFTPRKQTSGGGKVDLTGKCSGCGSTSHSKKECDKKDKTCYACGKKGHLSHVCQADEKTKAEFKAKRANKTAENQQETAEVNQALAQHFDNQETDGFARVSRGLNVSRICTARSLDAKSKVNKATPLLHLIFKTAGGNKIFEYDCIPDTGATQTMISANILKQRYIGFENCKVEPIYTANWSQLKCPGRVQLLATGGNNKPFVSIMATVCEDMKNEILVSWHDLQRLGSIPEEFPRVNQVSDASTTQHIPRVRASSATLNGADVRSRAAAEFPDVLKDALNETPMAGEPMRIHLRDDVEIKPRRHTKPRAVPLHQKEAAEAVIQELLAKKVIVKVNEPTDWCSPAFYVPKANGKLRLVTDFTYINRFIKRPIHPFPSSKDIMQGITSDSQVFMKIDAVHGYFQMALDEESSFLTTFIIDSGRYRYLRGPMGLSPTNDEWCFRSDRIIEGLPWASKIVDDILVQAPNYTVLWDRARTVFLRCRQENVAISLKKFDCGSEIVFAGHVISAAGVKPDPDQVKAISAFPTPQNTTDVRSFLGMANQLGAFLPDLAQATPALRQLIMKGVAFVWYEPHQEEFERLKKLLTSDLLCKAFNPKLRTELLTDASRLNGLGFCLVQRDDTDKPRLITCGSCSLTDTQSRYATIEIEMLAIQWAIQKCQYYLRGIETFTVVTDHKPLLGVLNKDVGEIENPRLQRLCMKLVGMSFTIRWQAGKLHEIADALSRYPVFPAEAGDMDLARANVAICRRVADLTPCHKLHDAAAADADYRAIIACIEAEWKVNQIPASHPAAPLKKMWHELSVIGADHEALILVNGSRIYVPQAARKEILHMMHEAHSGITKTRELANQLYYWPGINNDIELLVKSCKACQKLQASAPLEKSVEPKEALAPMSHIGVDLFEFQGHDYLLAVCRYSGWPFQAQLRSTTTSAITDRLSFWFNQFGFPVAIRSDGGPQFRTQFSQFCRTHGINHTVSSPYNPRSNGLAESSVKQVKQLLKKSASNKDFESALQAYCSVPRSDGFSPAMIMFGRRLRRSLPMLPQHLAILPDVQTKGHAARLEHAERARKRFDEGKVTLPPLQVGDRVLIQAPPTAKPGVWDVEGEILDVRESGHSYVVLPDDSDTPYTRNRRFLRKIEPKQSRPAPIIPTNEWPTTPATPANEPAYTLEQMIAYDEDESAPWAPAVRKSPRIAQQEKIDYSLTKRRGQDRACLSFSAPIGPQERRPAPTASPRSKLLSSSTNTAASAKRLQGSTSLSCTTRAPPQAPYSGASVWQPQPYSLFTSGSAAAARASLAANIGSLRSGARPRSTLSSTDYNTIFPPLELTVRTISGFRRMAAPASPRARSALSNLTHQHGHQLLETNNKDMLQKMQIQ